MSLRTANYLSHYGARTFLLALLLATWALPAHAIQKVISGQVRGDKNEILRGVKVDLWTTDGSVSMSTRTDSKGKFSFTHEKCDTCFLEVFAPKKSNLASALVDDIPGDEGRSVIVTLKKGYPVTGRVISEGKGLKGVIVKAYSSAHDRNRKERVYGGGATITDRSGNFQITLTPGDKRIVLLNNKFDKLSKSTSFNAKVIVETDLGEIELPSR